MLTSVSRVYAHVFADAINSKPFKTNTVERRTIILMSNLKHKRINKKASFEVLYLVEQDTS